MFILRLLFAEGELHRTHYERGDIRLVCARGKVAGPERVGNFQWTRAVHGLALLLVRSALWQVKHTGSLPVIRGGKGSLAASLDYAVGKPPIWIHEMFGSDASGDAMLRRMLLRENPERRRGGEVVLGFTRSFLQDTRIEITNGKHVLEPSELVLLHEKLLSSDDADDSPVLHGECPGEFPKPFDNSTIRDLLIDGFCAESVRAFNSTSIFTQRSLKQAFETMAVDCEFAGLERCGQELFKALSYSRDGVNRLGLGINASNLSPLAQREKPIRVAVPFSQAAPLALFSYLQKVRNISFELDDQYPHAIAIMNKLMVGGFDPLPELIILGIAPAATIMSYVHSLGYQPIMILPAMSHRVVSTANGRGLGGKYLFLNSDRSTSLMYYNALQARGDLKKSDYSHGDPDEIFEALTSEEDSLRAIIYFPHYVLNERFNGCTLLDESSDSTNLKQTILFALSDFLRTPKVSALLETSLRDAWLTLRDHPELLRPIFTDVINDRRFLTSMKRISGLYLRDAA